MSTPTDERQIHKLDDLHDALACVSFEKSCIDMGWKWEVRTVFVPVDDSAPLPENVVLITTQSFGPYDTVTLPQGQRYRVAWEIRCSFRRPERDTGAVGEGFGRWWPVDPGVTESGLWKTMWLAVTTNVTHEQLEAFKVLGRRPFDPHRSIRDLVGLPLPAERVAAPMTSGSDP